MKEWNVTVAVGPSPAGDFRRNALSLPLSVARSTVGHHLHACIYLKTWASPQIKGASQPPQSLSAQSLKRSCLCVSSFLATPVPVVLPLRVGGERLAVSQVVKTSDTPSPPGKEVLQSVTD